MLNREIGAPGPPVSGYERFFVLAAPRMELIPIALKSNAGFPPGKRKSWNSGCKLSIRPNQHGPPDSEVRGRENSRSRVRWKKTGPLAPVGTNGWRSAGYPRLEFYLRCRNTDRGNARACRPGASFRGTVFADSNPTMKRRHHTAPGTLHGVRLWYLPNGINRF